MNLVTGSVTKHNRKTTIFERYCNKIQNKAA